MRFIRVRCCGVRSNWHYRDIRSHTASFCILYTPGVAWGYAYSGLSGLRNMDRIILGIALCDSLILSVFVVKKQTAKTQRQKETCVL